jgi:rhodanese-related sulfurtransferase
LYQNINKGIKKLLNEANSIVNTVSVEQAKLYLNSKEHLFIDLRDYREILKSGRIPGSYSCPRGMLEFWIDPLSPYHKKYFNQKKTYIFYCASAWRSALAAKSAIDMGLKPVYHIQGGFTEWVKQGGKIIK